jgi:hypothetical protein
MRLKRYNLPSEPQPVKKVDHSAGRFPRRSPQWVEINQLTWYQTRFLFLLLKGISHGNRRFGFS